MITTNFKLEVRNNKNSYDEKYARAYLDRRNGQTKEDWTFFKGLLDKYGIDLKGEAVADFASGVGADLKILSEFGPKQIFWHDKMEGVHKIAKENLGSIDNVSYHVGDMMDFSAYQDSSVKLGICRDSLSYIGNDHLFFTNLKRILKEGGYFWCKDVSIKYYEEMVQKPFVVVLKKNILAWPLYKATGLRLLAFIGSDPNRLKYIFKKLGFKVVYLKEEGRCIEFLIQK